MKKIILSKEAIAHIDEICIWYQKQSPDLDQRFIDEIELHLKYISSYPESFSIRYDDFRVAYMLKFPYSIHYTVLGDLILVTAILHQHRRLTTD